MENQVKAKGYIVKTVVTPEELKDGERVLLIVNGKINTLSKEKNFLILSNGMKVSANSVLLEKVEVKVMECEEKKDLIGKLIPLKYTQWKYSNKDSYKLLNVVIGTLENNTTIAKVEIDFKVKE